MSRKPTKIVELIAFEKKSAQQDLDYFKNLVSDAILLNNLGILKGNPDYEHLVKLASFDEIFIEKSLDYYRKRLTSNIFLDKKTNELYNEILKLPLQELIDGYENQIIKLSEIKIEELRLELYYRTIFTFLIKYTNNLEKIRFEYDLKSIDEKINNRVSILHDSKICLYSPLLFKHETWEKIIINELMASDSFEEIEQKKKKFVVNLTELEGLLDYDFKNFLLIDVNEIDHWLNCWNTDKTLFIYPMDFWLSRKKYFLETLGSNKLKKLFNQDIIKRYNEVKKSAKKLKTQLKKGKIEVKHEKYLKPITKGMTYLLSKENSNFPKPELRKLAEKLINNLFYSSNREPEENIINTSIKINNVVLVEYILFLKEKKQYLKNKKISIPRLISENINYDSKGFSYQNLNKIYNTIKTKKEFNFNGHTSIYVLSNEMKMRN